MSSTLSGVAIAEEASPPPTPEHSSPFLSNIESFKLARQTLEATDIFASESPDRSTLRESGLPVIFSPEKLSDVELNVSDRHVSLSSISEKCMFN